MRTEGRGIVTSGSLFGRGFVHGLHSGREIACWTHRFRVDSKGGASTTVNPNIPTQATVNN